MAQEGWIERKLNDNQPTMRMGDVADIRPSRETNEVLRRAGLATLSGRGSTDLTTNPNLRLADKFKS